MTKNTKIQNFSKYNPLKLKEQEYRLRVFLVVFYVSILLVVGKLIESVSVHQISFLDIVRDFIFGLGLLGLQILVMEKSGTIK